MTENRCDFDKSLIAKWSKIWVICRWDDFCLLFHYFYYCYLIPALVAQNTRLNGPLEIIPKERYDISTAWSVGDFFSFRLEKELILKKMFCLGSTCFSWATGAFSHAFDVFFSMKLFLMKRCPLFITINEIWNLSFQM